MSDRGKIGEFKFEGDDPGLGDLFPPLPHPYEWRFLAGGRVKHAVNTSVHSVVAVCGVSVWTFWNWCGTGSWREGVTLGGLPDCKKCSRALGLG